MSTRGSYCSIAGVLDRLVPSETQFRPGTKPRAQVGSYDGNMYKLDAELKLVWKSATLGQVWSSATISDDGAMVRPPQPRILIAQDS